MNKTIEYYEKNAKDFCESTINIDMSKCWDKFLKHLRSNSYILDVGCGSGRDSLYFINKGYKVLAIDASKQICIEAEKILNQKVLNKSFNEIDFIDTFDGIWACASLLHIPKGEIKTILNKLYDSLKVDGVLYASFKYGNNERNDNERFFNDYNKNTILELFDNDKFNIEEIFITEDAIPKRETLKWINIIVTKKGLNF